MSAPIIILHRRNRAELLTALPAGAWVEIDIDLLNGVPVLTHKPLMPSSPAPPKLGNFLPQALRRGVTGFILDCKRENIERLAEPVLAEHKIVNYFYINEMEVQGDMCLARERLHKTAIRIWQYRGARDLVRYVEDRRKAKENAPGWAYIDCWKRGLMEDIAEAFIPLNQGEAHGLQKMDVKLCVCSPELYAHRYDVAYKTPELEGIYRGVMNYRKKLMHAGIMPDAVCTKFPWLWTMDVDLLGKAKNLGATT